MDLYLKKTLPLGQSRKTDPIMEYRLKNYIDAAKITALTAEQTQRLQQAWWTEDDFVALLAASSSDFLIAYFLLEQLKKWQALELRMAEEGHALYLPLHYADFHFPKEIALPERLRLSRWAYLRADVEEPSESHALCSYLWLRSSKSLVRYRCKAEELPLLFTPGDKLNDFQRKIYYILLAEGVLLPAEAPQEAAGAWEFHDQLFFAESTEDTTLSPTGARFAPQGSAPTLYKEPMAEEAQRIALPIVALPKERRFAEVLHSRRTDRHFSEAALPLPLLAAFLRESMQVQQEEPSGLSEEDRVSYRPSPSGGARHALECYLRIDRVEGLTPGLYHYLPQHHALEPLPLSEEGWKATARLCYPLRTKSDFPPQVCCFYASRLRRISWKYTGIAYRLALLDLGCLLQTQQLVATSIGMKSCIFGAVEGEAFAKAFGTDMEQEPFIGELIIGI